jgi:amino acid adenylation domain-containing protein
MEQLASGGVRLWQEEGKLLFRAPKGAMTPELAAAVKQRREEILELLRRDAPIPRQPEQPDYELSHAQRRLWILSRIEEGSAAYNVPLHQFIEGDLDRAALERALADLIRRHESLRTTFDTRDSEPRQIVHAEQPLDFEYLDFTEQGHEAALELARRESAQPFDLKAGPLMRMKLVRVGAAQHFLLMTLHHLICDGVSVAVLASELNALYGAYTRGEASPLPPLRIQYRDFAHWQNRELEGAAAHREYWQSKMAAPHPVLDLPLDFPRPRRQSFQGREISFELPPERFAPLAQLARETGSSLFVVLQAMVKTLLHRYSGQDDIVIGSPFAGQNHPDLEGQIGFYINMLPLRDRTPGDMPFRDLVIQVRRTVAEAYEHQTWPFDLIVRDAGIERDMARSPLFDVSVILQSQADEGLALPGLRARSCFEHSGTSKFDLTWCFKEVAGRLILSLEYATALFSAVRVERMGRHFERLAESIAADASTPLDELAILPGDELVFCLSAEAPARHPRGRATVVEMFREQAAREPNRVAIQSEDGLALTYAELDRRSDAITGWLCEKGVEPDDRIAVLLPRSLDLPATLLGVLKAGAAYIPLDPALPAARLQMILDDARPKLTIRPEDLENLIAPHPPRPPRILPENLAYVIYTSGSTGKPKGVAVTHRSLANFLVSMRRAPGLEASDTLLAVTTVSFDIAALELFLPLTQGARVVIASHDTAIDGNALRHAIHAHGITVLQATPATWEMLLAAGWEGGPRFRAFCGGEALRAHLAAALACRVSELWNLYGPTETTVWSAARRIDAATAAQEDPSPVGGPVDATQLRVLNRRYQPQPLGVPGELYIGGDGLARGYVGNPRLTAEKFVPDPFASETGSRMYATGDLVRLREDGLVSFLGRGDHQIKIRGFRIETGDIEAAVAQLPGVRECIVMLREDPPLLTAYVLPETAAQPGGAAQLREALRERLPEYMVPQAFVIMEAWPLNPNGKVDRRALPAPERAAQSASATRPRNAREEIVCGLFAELLPGSGIVNPDDDFFGIGGHSLLALRLANRIRDVFAIDLPIRSVFESPTPAGIAALIEQGGTRTPSPTREPRPERIPLSWAQSRLWFLHRRGGGAAYNIPAALRLEGELQLAALEAALNDVIARHEILRTTYPEAGGEAFQRIVPAEQARPSLRQESAHPHRLAARIEHLAAEPIDIETQLPLRATLLRIAPQTHVLLLVLHHIAGDGWSLGPLAADLSLAYQARLEGSEPAFAPLPIQYADYTLWQQRYVSAGIAGQLEFWRSALAGIPNELPLPFDNPRTEKTGNRGGALSLHIGPALHAQLLSLSRTTGATLFMVLQAGFAALLHRLGAGIDIPIGTPVAGRNDAALDASVGLFVNTLVLRADVSEDPSFTRLIERVRAFTLNALGNQDVPFEQLVAELQPARPGNRHPLFQVLIALQNLPAAQLSLPGLSAGMEPFATSTAKFDLSLNLDERDAVGGIDGTLEYNAELFTRTKAEAIAQRFILLLERAVAQPALPLSELDALLPGEREHLLKAGNPVTRTLPETTLTELLETQAAMRPDAPALIFNDETITFGELHGRANRLARELGARGIGPESACGICLPRSIEALVAILAVLKAGGAYVPLDPEYPEARLSLILDVSRPQVVLCSGQTRHRLPASQSTLILDNACSESGAASTPIESGVLPQNPAYAIYTSGSTGLPKGILIPHAAAVNLIAAVHEFAKLTPASRMLQFASLNFDASVLEIFPAWAAGACVILAGSEDRNPERLPALLRRQKVTHLFLTPAVLALLEPDPDLGLECLMFGGEACPAEIANRWSRICPSFNAYGPTETTVMVTASEELRGNGAPIGRPLLNTRAYVLNPALQPVPPGVEGELFIAGPQLARGYAAQPAFTAERFLPDPFSPTPGGRMYRTGDAVRFRADGQLEFVRRLDHQVKIHGHRIELRDIEATLELHPAIRQAAVIVVSGPDGDPALAAFVARHEGHTPEPRDIRRFAQDRLPSYMVPAAIAVLDRLPLAPTGKIDRRALTALEISYTAPESIEPRDDVERLIAGIFREVLRREKLGVTDEFFELGGHSLLATQVASRIRTVFGVELPLARFFEGSTVAKLAAYLRESEAAPGRTLKIAAAHERLKNMSPEEKARLLQSKRAMAASNSALRV